MRDAHLLVIEDHHADIELLREALQECASTLTVHAVPDAIVAFNFLGKKGRYSGAPDADAIILDVMLPIIDGVEALRVIKHTPAWNAIPVVVMTASPDGETHQRCRDLGAAAVWVKPQTWPGCVELAEVVRHCMEQSPNVGQCLKAKDARAQRQ